MKDDWFSRRGSRGPRRSTEDDRKRKNPADTDPTPPQPETDDERLPGTGSLLCCFRRRQKRCASDGVKTVLRVYVTPEWT